MKMMEVTLNQGHERHENLIQAWQIVKHYIFVMSYRSATFVFTLKPIVQITEPEDVMKLTGQIKLLEASLA